MGSLDGDTTDTIHVANNLSNAPTRYIAFDIYQKKKQSN